MSQEHAEQFHSAMSTDEDLRNQVAEASAKVLEIARSRGLHFTRDEMVKVLAERFDDSAAEDGGANAHTSIASERPGL